MNKKQGFTLLEVLLALLVLSVALGGLVAAGHHGASALLKLEQRSAAYHVADQVMMQMYQQRGGFEAVTEGQHMWRGTTWYWRAETEATDNPRIGKITVKVAEMRQFDYAQAVLQGFKPQ